MSNTRAEIKIETEILPGNLTMTIMDGKEHLSIYGENVTLHVTLNDETLKSFIDRFKDRFKNDD